MDAADAMIALRATDGSSPLVTIIPTGTAVGQYLLTTGCAAGLFYNWQNVTPFGIADSIGPTTRTPATLWDAVLGVKSRRTTCARCARNDSNGRGVRLAGPCELPVRLRRTLRPSPKADPTS
jgi:hypothetical protein